MASSFITKDNIHGFWIDDSLMQVVCWGIANVIDAIPSNVKNYWLTNDCRERIYDNSQGIFIGFMNLGLDDFLINQERKNLFSEILYRTKEFILARGDYISVDDLNDFQLISEVKREWISPLETKRIIKVLSYIDDVVNDKITSEDIDEIDYDF